jgi:hypothetical protein
MALMVYSGAWGNLIHEKNQKSKISWHYPFKVKKYGRKFLSWSSLSNYLLPHWAELLIPISPLFQLQYSFLIFVKAYPRTTEKRKHFCSALKYVLPVDKNLLKSGLYLVVFFILSLFSYWLLALVIFPPLHFRISTIFLTLYHSFIILIRLFLSYCLV